MFKQLLFQIDQPLFELRNGVARCGLASGRNLGGAVKLGQSETRRVRLNPEIDRSIANFAHDPVIGVVVMTTPSIGSRYAEGVRFVNFPLL